MPKTKREEELDALKAEVQRLRLDCYNRCRFIAGLEESKLRLYGYRTKEQAFVSDIRRTELVVEKLYQEFDRKYPD
jgi:hypothetical protein